MGETARKEPDMKQLWDGLLIEHPIIGVAGALLVVALTGGGVALC